jgi:hypothetical protein
MTALRRRLPLRRALFLALVAILVAMLLIVAFWTRALVRTSPVFDPPVLAGQMVSCTAGFYARRDTTIVLTISGHCYDRANPPQDAAGRPIGSYGAEARRADCPAGRTCAGSDIVELVLAPGGTSTSWIWAPAATARWRPARAR